MHTKWKEVRLGDIMSIISGYAYKGEFIGKGDYVLLGMGCVSFSEKFLSSGARYYSQEVPDRYLVNEGDIVLATRQQSDNLPILGMPAFIPKRSDDKRLFIGANLYKVENNSEVDNKFIFWLLKTPFYVDYIKSCQTGTTVRMITKKDIESFTFMCPSLEEREKISKILWDIDDKIENNRKINENLEQQAQALFKSWFIDFEPFKDGKFIDSELGLIPEGWKVMSLSDIANYLNGLAMQKYRPNNGEKGLPVLKIKELGAGQCDSNSDLCSSSINEDYIVNDGDVIFSWSGTLLVDIWCGGKCGLNQHLFKVTSSKYPKWFYYLWTLHHLSRFINIAKDKAVTMGHIKRGELDTSLVCIPPENEMENATSLIEPYIKNNISLRVENRKLASLRDALLPKLMSGEIEV